MQFTIVHPDGKTERRQHIKYTVKQTGFVWCAYSLDGSLLARDYLSELHLRRSCDSMTEPASIVRPLNCSTLCAPGEPCSITADGICDANP
jgi:hypothetical protein